MNAVHITIKHAFAVFFNRWKIYIMYLELKMGQKRPHVKEMLVIAYLLSKSCVTLQGLQVEGTGIFFCNLPSLEAYLELLDEYGIPEPNHC